MHILTEDGLVVCSHELGIVKIEPGQTLVTIEGRKVLVEIDPQGRPISGCPMVGPGIKACLTTLAVKEGYSDLMRIDGKRICLDTVTGLTDGTPPGTVKYKVNKPGQNLVEEIE
ncbi:MAG: hypothetical protein EHM38_10280 [Geobacteraceae bacterium]|nr:MAG: hypothetical protein EHM38_10280 [Geobacteraceae bacterium]